MPTPAMIGREPELAVARRLIEAAGSGHGGALLVLGEAGIGKSRLLREAAVRARAAGLLVLTGRAAEGTGTYRPIAQALLGHLRGTRLAESAELRPYRAALDRVLPGWAGARPEPGGGVEASVDPVLVLGEGLLRLLCSLGGAGGALLLLEDLHWADADTLALVGYLAGAVHGAPVLLAVSARDDWPGSAAVERLAATEGVTTLRLARLTPAEVGALAGSRTGTPVPESVLRFLIHRSEGVPFLVEELLAGLGEAGSSPGVPRTFAALVDQRLAVLTPAHRRSLAAAAVLGTDPDWSLLPRVSDLTEHEVLAGLRAATAAHLLVADGGRLRWRHALTRDAVLATLLPPEHAALARCAADVLSSRGGQDDEAAAAELLSAAGEPARAVDIWLRLAGRDLARGALRSAEGLLRRAGSTGARPTSVAIERVLLLTLTGQVMVALDEGAAALGDATGNEHAELALRLARAAIAAGRWTDAERYLERAGRPGDPRSLVLAADAAHGAGRVHKGAVHAAEAARCAELDGRPDVLCEALLIVGRIARLTDVAAAGAAFRRAAQVAAEQGLTPLRVEALLGLGTVELLKTEVSLSLLQARELALDAGLLAQAAAADVILTDQTLIVDGPKAVDSPGRRLVETGVLLHLPAVAAAGEIALALGRAAVGDVPGMEAFLAAAAGRQGTTLEMAALVPAARALPALLAHDLPRANALVDGGMSLLVGHVASAPLHQFGLWALLRTATGDRDEQARATLRGLPAALRPANRGALAYADAVVAGRAGHGDTAAAHFADADRIMAGMPWLRRLLRPLALEAAVTDGWGDPVPALRAELAELAEHERTGEHQLARTCRDLLRRAGAPTRRGRGAATVPPGLRAAGITSREMDVLALIADGLTNAQVAQRLYLSPRTVETHVANLLAKSGTLNRTELRGWSAAQTP